MLKNFLNKIKKHKFLCGCVILFLVVELIVFRIAFTEKTTSSIWDGTIASSFSGGSGTNDDPYIIKEGSEFAYLLSVLNSEEHDDYFNKFYSIQNNINFDNLSLSFEGFNTFSGYIDGNGYTLFNIVLDKPTNVDEKDYYSLFGNLNGANINNINFGNIEINIDNDESLSEIELNDEMTEEEIMSLLKQVNASFIANDVTSSSISNVSIYDISINNLCEKCLVNSSLMIVNDISNNKLFNINVDGESNLSNTTGLIYSYNDASLNNIIYSTNNLDLVNDYEESENETLYSYSIKDEKIVFENDYYYKSILELLNNDSSLGWKLDNNNFKLINNGKDPVAVKKAPMLKAKSLSAPSAHASGVDGSIVYVNDYEADYNYYMGRNYTDSSDNNTPTLNDKQIYTDNNLVYVNAIYYGTNVEGSHTGYVSTSERQNQFNYYKVYKVNDNGTDQTSDDYVEFDLIDNPFSDKPNGRGFNGWVTDYRNAEITLDGDIYVRKVKVPVTYSGSKPSSITINFYASWTVSNVGYLTNGGSWANAFSTLESGGMHVAKSRTPYYENVSGYYFYKSISLLQSYPSGAYNSSARSVSGRCYSLTCNYYIATGSSQYDSSQTYYKMNSNSFSQYTPQIAGYNTVDRVQNGEVIAGYYKQVNIARNASQAGYYNSNGIMQSGTCSTNGGCTLYELQEYYDGNGNVQTAGLNDLLYYLNTRDTNIVVLSGNNSNNLSSSQNYPFTFTSVNNGENYINSAAWNVGSNTVDIYADMRIENIKITSNTNKAGGTISPGTSSGARLRASWYNFKAGRGIVTSNNNNTNFSYMMGGKASSTGSNNSPTRYSFIVESGVYNALAVATGTAIATYNINAYTVYGSDYDRVKNDNSHLNIVYCAAGAFGGTISTSAHSNTVISSVIKSGQFGSNKYDYTTGVYVGARGLTATLGGADGVKQMIVEGGSIYNLIGEPSASSSMEAYNDIFIYIKGGSTDIVFGGAGETESQGNRIIQMTGGQVNYSVFGGSNGASGGSSTLNNGKINGDSYVYIGGNAIVGDSSLVANNQVESESSSEAGSVFGVGNGNSRYSTIGTMDNSNIIIADSALVRRNVYGGGNYGAVGLDTASNTNIKIVGGTVSGNIYGGGNQNGAGADGYNANVNIAMTDGEVTGSIYGGSKTKGQIFGPTDINITGGTIRTDIYGGGEGGYTNNTNYGTFAKGNILVTIGDNTSGPTINGNVYGGSAYGTVNALRITNPDTNQTTETNQNTNTKVIVNNGTILGSVFGGAKGNNTFTPKVYGNIEVDINGGTINNVFGGFDEAGTPTAGDVVYLNSGTITNAYGGGNKTSLANTYIYLRGSNVGSLYGGSNQSGSVTTANVYVESGLATNVYGGNNSGGTCATTNITATGATVTNLYGGGNYAATTTDNVNISANAIITNAYGGGNNAGCTTANVNVISGTPTIGSVYGGSNNSGNVTNANVSITAGNITNAYGGGNLASVTTPIITMSNGTVNDLYGGGKEAQVTTSTNVTITGGTITNEVYGGGDEGTVLNNTNVLLNGATIEHSAYAGGKGITGVVYGNTNMSVTGNTTVGTTSCTNLSNCGVYGGGKAAPTGASSTNNSKSLVNIASGTIYGNVYGGANTSVVYGTTEVNIASANTNSSLTSGDILINGTVFGGGEANAAGSTNYDFSYISVTNGIEVNIDGNNYSHLDINGSIFGSGNASSTSGTSNININNYGVYGTPKKNISIQRTDLLLINNSAIALHGETDSTNDYSATLFSLSRIKELDLKNNSTLYLESGANLLEKWKSLNSDGTLASVLIDTDQETLAINGADNRLYMYEGKVLNIAKDQSVTNYGEVYGMTFFGLFKYNSNNTIYTGIYDKYDYGDSLTYSTFTSGSYVLGLHKLNHDINIDGFYSNYINEDTLKNEPNYIVPTPEDSEMYMWIVGELMAEYDVDLVASKYSTLGTFGTQELSLVDFAEANTTFEILGFDYSGLDSDITLVEKSQIPRVASSGEVADSVMGLTVETSNTGWLNNGQTSFVTDANNPIVGTRSYIGGNNTSAPSLLFYLNHSKNIATEGDMGTVRIVLMAITRVDDLTNDTKRLVINVNLSRHVYNTIEYEAALTPGRKYEMFTSTSSNITNKSQLSAYYSIYAEDVNNFTNGSHRTLVSNKVLPLNTKITMIDLGGSEVKYYYHIINQNDVTNATEELARQGDIYYYLSMFETMGAVDSGVYYDDATMNNEYYDSQNRRRNEEFIFIFDFKDTNISADVLNGSLLFELLDANDVVKNTVLGVEQSNMVYNIYTNKEAVIDVNGSISDNVIYNGKDFTIDLVTDYTQSKVGSSTIYDTQYFDSKLGSVISLYNSDNELVSGTSLLGLYYEIDGVRYYPNIDGTTRIKLADRVDSIESWIKVVTGTSEIATGNYKLKIETFGSPDGIYYGLSTSDSVTFDIRVINEIYGLNININSNSLIIDAESGKTAGGSSTIINNISYNSGLANPSLHLKVYRRRYDTVYDTNYELISLSDLTNVSLFETSIPNEYLIVNNPNVTQTYSIPLKTNLQTGTYKLEFILYDDNTSIGTVEKYIIIK